MPKDNIERARASGVGGTAGGAGAEEVVYEGKGEEEGRAQRR